MLRYTKNKFLFIYRHPELASRLSPSEREAFVLHILRNTWFFSLLLSLISIVLAAATGWLIYGVSSSRLVWNWLPLVLMLVLLPLATFVRNESYKANWDAHAVTPPGYHRANRLKIGLEALVPAAIIVLFTLRGPSAPAAFAGLMWLGWHVANFPHGLPMKPQEPRLGGPN